MSPSTPRRALAALLLALLYLPVHRLLDPTRAGPAGAATREIVDPVQGLVVWGTLSLLLLGTALSLVVPAERLRGPLRRLGGLLEKPGSLPFAATAGLLSLGLGTAVSLGVHRAVPTLFDSMVQLLHARHFAEGLLAGPLPEPAAARVVQNGLITPEGWASVYPPGHTLLLAAGLRVGTPWLVGPLLTGVTTLFTALLLDRLLDHRRAVARTAALAVALAPFGVILGSTYLSHASLAAATATALYLAVRAWHGTAWWALPAGIAAAYGVTARPWSGLVLGGTLTALLWVVTWWRDGRPAGWLLGRLGLAAAGGAPLGVLLLGYDTVLFGGPFTLGYEVAFGEAHGLGFHRDPWGNLYGVREALAYTAADLTALGLRLLETPLPALAPAAGFLLTAPRISVPTRILLAWGLAPVVANFFYWHHGMHLGPRMLLEAAPAWTALAVIGAVGLVEGGRDPGVRPARRTQWARARWSAVLLWAFLLSLPAGAFLFLPGRIDAIRWTEETLARTEPPVLPEAGREAIVFVHGGWTGRVAARLAASGMRRDSVETALRRNDLCRVHLHTEARMRAAPSAIPLDFRPLPGTPPHLRTVPVGGVPVRLDPSFADPACAREARADRFGTIELAPLLWQTPLPATGGRMLLFRDLGPRENAALLERYADRAAWLYVPGEPAAAPRLRPYAEAILEVWGEDAEEPAPGVTPARPGGG